MEGEVWQLHTLMHTVFHNSEATHRIWSEQEKECLPLLTLTHIGAGE